MAATSTIGFFRKRPTISVLNELSEEMLFVQYRRQHSIAYRRLGKILEISIQEERIIFDFGNCGFMG